MELKKKQKSVRWADAPDGVYTEEFENSHGSVMIERYRRGSQGEEVLVGLGHPVTASVELTQPDIETGSIQHRGAHTVPACPSSKSLKIALGIFAMASVCSAVAVTMFYEYCQGTLEGIKESSPNCFNATSSLHGMPTDQICMGRFHGTLTPDCHIAINPVVNHTAGLRVSTGLLMISALSLGVTALIMCFKNQNFQITRSTRRRKSSANANAMYAASLSLEEPKHPSQQTLLFLDDDDGPLQTSVQSVRTWRTESSTDRWGDSRDSFY